MLFFTDLDNTLIYSHRKLLPEDKVVVEFYEGNEQSFMTKKTFDFFSNYSDMLVIPVTTRTIEQYNRIFALNENFQIEYALVNNGGTLLVNGEQNQDWEHETLVLCKDDMSELEHIHSWLLKSKYEKNVVSVTPYFFYVRGIDVEEFSRLIKKMADPQHVIVEGDARKVYIHAKHACKGTAINRFMKKYKYKECVAAGDSVFDLSMLQAATYSIASYKLAAFSKQKGTVYIRKEIISDDICEYLRTFE